MPLGLVHDPIFQEHDPGDYHCESPLRLAALDKALAAWPGLQDTLRIPLRPATMEELTRVHTPRHLARIAATAGRNTNLDPDTGTSPRSHEVALLAAGSLIDLCDAALAGDVDNGMAMVRPPGHHATPERAMGFCLFNNVAIAAAHLLETRGLDRVLIVDWDVHHGNGTEDCFFRDPRVFYFSVHQSPLYPGTGPLASVGAGDGEGFTLNLPLMAGQGDLEYLCVFEELLKPLARAFSPQFILVSAGFDSHQDDPLGGMAVTEAGFAGMALIINEIAQELCPGRVVAALEGGYSPSYQARSVLAVLEALSTGHQPAALLRQAARTVRPPAAMDKARAIMAKYWPVLREQE